ncbi:MAG TPA: glutamate racemase [Gammaproteobacteria bacterium]|nr:glutamate racemase [Gammaproteobacteria bacterium]
MTASDSNPDLPIGVFDSGVGGLTVLRAIRAALPNESAIYLGDTARVPYGTKSRESVLRYSLQASDQLVRRGIKLLVVACNTASATSLPEIRVQLAPLPVVGVVEPGAQAGVAASKRQRHLVLATEATVSQGAYTRAIRALEPRAAVEELACSLFVALAEEGWTEGPTADAAAQAYLGHLAARREEDRPDSVILGCTHFPLVAGVVRKALGPAPSIVDSATATAKLVRELLERERLARTSRAPARLDLLVTDGAARFARLGPRFLGESFAAADVELVDL